MRFQASSRFKRVSHVRRGFTLVELIIAMGIIAVLVGISAAGIRAGLNSARETETRALIALLDGVLQDRIKVYQSNVISSRRGYYSLASRSGEFADRFSGGASSPLPGAPNSDPLSSASATHFVKKSLFASVFPQRFQDLCGFDGRPGAPAVDDANGPSVMPWTDYDYSTDPNDYRPVDLFELGLGGNLSDDPPTARVIRSAVEELGADVDLSRHDPRTESAELLYLCLTRPILPDLPFVSVDSIPPNRVADTDNDGLPEFIDGFEQPLRFYTFTTGLFRPTEWTWDTSTVRPDVTGVQAALAYSLAGDATGSISPPIVGHVAAPNPNPDAKNLFNLDTDDRFGAVRTSDVTDMSGGGTLGDQELANEAGFALRHRSSTATVADAPNIPVNLGTLSIPLIVSLGPDAELGLNEPSRAPTASEPNAHYSKLRYATPLAAPSAADDNLTNLEGPF